jgi:hypothetical protein
MSNSPKDMIGKDLSKFRIGYVYQVKQVDTSDDGDWDDLITLFFRLEKDAEKAKSDYEHEIVGGIVRPRDRCKAEIKKVLALIGPQDFTPLPEDAKSFVFNSPGEKI